ncbi:MAG: glycosyltransferase, partial [Methanothrix sp.]|nr:glycosyltransferase [Methanothrix sp.]
MKDGPSVSIITPTYNHERYIAECIDSVLAQSYPYWEQIIIDDGSSDGTQDVISLYKDKRIKYIRQENKGIWRLGETYNKALQLA